MGHDPDRFKQELEILAHLDRQIAEIERIQGVAASAPLRRRMEKQAAEVIDGDHHGRLIYLTPLTGGDYLRISHANGFVRASVASSKRSRINYDFVNDVGLRTQLARDNVVMENSVYGAVTPSDSAREWFTSFCLSAQWQVEPLVHHLYCQTNEPFPLTDAGWPNYSRAFNDLGDYFYVRPGKFKFRHNDPEFRILDGLRCLRNDVVHRRPLPTTRSGLEYAASKGQEELELMQAVTPYAKGAYKKSVLDRGLASELLLLQSPRPVRRALKSFVDNVSLEIQRVIARPRGSTR